MGSGQSKFFRRNNDYDYRPQYPFIPPSSGYPFPQPTGFIPNYVPNGYPTGPMFPQPQGFIPPENYGQGRFLPPPQLSWLPQDKQRKKRKSRRTESGQFVGGFQPGATTGGQPQPQPQQRRESRSRRARSESHRRDDPEPRPRRQSTSRSGNRRAPTPFIPSVPGDREDDGDGDQHHGPAAGSEPNRVPLRHSVRYPTPPPIRAELANVIEPLEDASAAAFGPTGPRPRTPLSNPLPPPPRDLYEMTPYKSLLSLPQTTALLTATYGPQTSGAQLGMQPTAQRKKAGKSGLFRAFSKREKKEPDLGQPQTQFIPVFVSSTPDETKPSTQAAIANLVRSQSQQTRVTSLPPMPVTPNTGGLRNVQASPHSAYTHSSGGNSSSQDSVEPIPPVPPMPMTAPTLHFDQKGLLSTFLTHSPHRVLYEGKIYPTALHLHEALKFLNHRPDIAEMIRNCSVAEVYPLAAKFQALVRPDWNSRFIEFMADVLKLKFTQHPDLRSTLLGTGTALIVYDDPLDTFWGSGPDHTGQNELGKLLVHIREILRAESVGM